MNMLSKTGCAAMERVAKPASSRHTSAGCCARCAGAGHSKPEPWTLPGQAGSGERHLAAKALRVQASQRGRARTRRKRPTQNSPGRKLSISWMGRKWGFAKARPGFVGCCRVFLFLGMFIR